MVGFGIANLVDTNNQDQLTALDLMQFSMSVFFFTNTLIRPQMASAIIKNAQESHVQNIVDTMTDGDAKATFQRFVDVKGVGTITDNSKIIRTINRINNPTKVFEGTSDIRIGGRKGKTLLVYDVNNRANRINPNHLPTFTETNHHIPTIRKNIRKLLQQPDIVEAKLNENSIFDNLTNRQIARVNEAIGGK